MSGARKALVWGAGGFVGGELLRLIVTHPQLELAAALSSTHAGQPIGALQPGLAPWTDLSFADPSDWSWEALREGSWVLFSAQPHTATMGVLPPVIEQLEGADVKLVDLSGDFRLADAALYKRHYGVAHAAPDLLPRFVYGLPESNAKQIIDADIVACPGCFATAAQLSLLPLAAFEPGVEFVAVDGKTGSSGAGVSPRETTHHPRRMNNYRAYKPLAHQHLPEIEGGWERAGGAPGTPISFVPQMAPMVRGIFITAHLFASAPVDHDAVARRYADYYRDAPFVRLVEGSPAVAEVWGTNRCDIATAAAGRVIAVSAAIDNLVKGAAGQAVQCLNLMCGWPETTGLETPPPAPV